MDTGVLALVALLVALLAGAGAALAYLSRAAGADAAAAAPRQRALEPEPVLNNRAARRRADRLGDGVRRRAAAAAAAAAAAPPPTTLDSDGEGDDDAPLRARDARRAARAAERDAADARAAKREARDEARLARDAEREAREAAEAAEKQRREDEEAAKWMAQIRTEDAGTAADEDAVDAGDLLAAFVDYIVSRKTVQLEELASAFGLRVTDAIDRVRELEAGGRITGVMDDRGKFIYVSKEEMQAVADYIKARGRVPIAELASKSADFIDLEAKEGAAAGPGGAAAAALDLDALAGEDEE